LNVSFILHPIHIKISRNSGFGIAQIAFGTDMAILKRLQYFYSSYPPLISNQLLHYGSLRKIQQNDAIWEVIFMLDSLVGFVSKGHFFINESEYTPLAQIRLLADGYDPYYDQNILKDNFEMDTINTKENDISLLSSPKLPSLSSYSGRLSRSHSGPSLSSSTLYQSSWKTALGGGLTHTITASISPTSSLQYLFPAPGIRCPRIRLFYIMRKIVRWMNDLSNKNSSRKPFLPKLNALMEHTVTRHQLHDALVEWHETFEPQWNIVHRLTDWWNPDTATI